VIGAARRPGKRSRRARIAPFHEAGHAVVAAIVARAFTAVVLDIHGGAFLFAPAESEASSADTHRELLVVLGGMAAESIRFGRFYRASCASDEDQSLILAWRADAVALDCLWGWAFERARDLVAEHWPAVLRIADELRRRRRIDSQRVRDIVNRTPVCQVVYRVPADYTEHRQQDAHLPAIRR
jgi:hypothetical protein